MQYIVIINTGCLKTGNEGLQSTDSFVIGFPRLRPFSAHDFKIK